MTFLNRVRSCFLNSNMLTKPIFRKAIPFTLGCVTLSAFTYSHQKNPKPLNTKLLCVLHDAGETALVPVLKQWESEGKEFKVLVMATAETVVKPDMFPGKRIILKDLGIDTRIDSTTERTVALSNDALQQFQKIKPQIVLVGVASQIQKQILEQYPQSITVAFVDNFNYDPEHESFATVEKVQAAAKHVLCPSKHVVDIFEERAKDAFRPTYHVVGKPSLEIWEKEVAAVDRKEVLAVLGIEGAKPIVTLIGGYGPGYDVVNPLFDVCAKSLRDQGYDVILQPHPKVAAQKVKTTEALAVSDFVVGYNSSVVFDAALIGKNAVYLVPRAKGVNFKHFAIDQGLIAEVKDTESLLHYLRSDRQSMNVREAIKTPHNSTEIISTMLEPWVAIDHSWSS